MRLWSWQLLPYLSDLQFKGQLRELVAIMHDWRDKGKTNHLLINRVMEYPKEDLYIYWKMYEREYNKRKGYSHSLDHYDDEFYNFSNGGYLVPWDVCEPFNGWHNKEYLRVCVCNLYEKYHFGIGKSKISQEEWDRVLQGYKEIIGEDWVL